MYSVISTDNNEEQIKRAIDEEVIFERVGTFTNEEALSVFQEASRVICSTLVVDIDIAPGNSIVQGMKIFKQARPLARIILIAPGRVPGDETVTKLFQKGIYDIIAPEFEETEGEEKRADILSPLSKSFNSPAATYSDATRWDVDIGFSTNSSGSGVKEKQKIVYEEREIIKNSVNQNIIAVGGASSCCGCTHMALQIAYYLSNHVNKQNVAILQLNEKNDFQVLGSFKSTRDCTEKSFSYKKIDFFYDTDLLEIKALKSLKNYNYIVLDLGAVKTQGQDGTVSLHKHFNYMKWADLSILVCNSKPWHLKDLTVSLFDITQSNVDVGVLLNNVPLEISSKSWNLLFNLSDDDFFQSFSRFLESNWNVFNSTYCPNLFKPYQELYECFNKLLSPVLPERDKVISSKRGFFKKKVV